MYEGLFIALENHLKAHAKLKTQEKPMINNPARPSENLINDETPSIILLNQGSHGAERLACIVNSFTQILEPVMFPENPSRTAETSVPTRTFPPFQASVREVFERYNYQMDRLETLLSRISI